MIKKLSVLILGLSLCVGHISAQTVTKGLIGKQDIHNWDGKTQTFTRTSSTGYPITLNDLDWIGVDVCQVYGGGVNRTSAALSAAITAIGTSENTELFLSKGNWVITGTLNIPANYTIRFAEGAYFTGTIAFAGSPDSQIKALPGQHIFSSTATVTFAKSGKVSVLWWGADNTGATDCSVSVQAAYTSLPNVGSTFGNAVGGEVFFPGGAYLIKDVTPKHGTRTYGEGYWSTSIRAKGATYGGFYVNLVTGQGTIFENLHFNTFTDGLGDDNTAFYIFGSNGIIVRNCWFNGYKQLDIRSSTDVEVSGNVFDEGTYPIVVGTSGEPINIRIINNEFYANSYPIILTEINNSVITGNIFYDCTYKNIDITASEELNISGNTFHSVTTPAADVHRAISVDSSETLSINGNVVEGPFKYGFYLEGMTGNVTGNSIKSVEIGALLTGTGEGLFTGNTIDTTSSYALQIPASNWVINSNNLINTGATGNATALVCTGDYNTIVGNKITSGGSTTVIDLTSGAENVVSKNSITGTYTTDISNITDNYVDKYVIIKTITYDPGSLNDGTGETSGNIAVGGAAFGDDVRVSAPYDLQGIIATAYVVSSNNVQIRLQNESGGAVDLASGTWTIRVYK